MTTSTEVTWEPDGIAMYATLVRPDGDGAFLAVVLVAGTEQLGVSYSGFSPSGLATTTV